jgi:predicted DCC family thiol-disulfide oxidoreductase YuxK
MALKGMAISTIRLTKTLGVHEVSNLPAGRNGGAWLIYDGECPFCRFYVKYLKIRESLGDLHLVDARENVAIVDEVRAAQIDLDKGMVLKIGNRIYVGAECIQILALLSSRSTIFSRVNALIFRSAALSRLLYPVFRAGRNMTLLFLGRTRIGGG